MTKKSLTLLLVLMLSIMLVFAFASCGGSENPSDISTDTGTGNTPGHTHSYGKWVTNKEPTCTETGEKKQTCSCGDVKIEAVEATGHTEQVLEAKEPTCTEEGLTEGVKCSVCGELLVEQTAIAKINHSFTNGICTVCDLDVNSEGLAYTMSDDGTYAIVTGIGDCWDSEIYIPATYRNLPVKRIETNAFHGKTYITGIHMPDTMTIVDNQAFMGCSGLKNVTIGCNMTELNSWTFGDCTSLETIVIPNSVTIMDTYVFSGCTSLKNITLPKSLRGIPDGAFSVCTSLESIELPSSITYVGSAAFKNCTSLKNIVVPDNVASIGAGAFGGCSSLESMTIPFVGSRKSAKTASAETLFGYIFYTSAYDGATAVEQYDGSNEVTYYIPSFLRNVTITDAGILPYSFYNCSMITNITIPQNLTSIGACAFSGSGITSFKIPSKVSVIERSLFYRCKSLVSVEIPNGVTSIEYGAFSECSTLESLIIPDTVTSFSGTLQNCSSLKTLVIGKGITNLPKAFLFGCSKLRSLTIPFVGSSKDATLKSESTLFGYIFGDTSYTGSVKIRQWYSYGTNGTWRDYYIPKCLWEVTVTGGAVLSGAFFGTYIEKLTLCEDVSEIEEYAFYYSNLIVLENKTGITPPEKAFGYNYKYCGDTSRVTITEEGFVFSASNRLMGYWGDSHVIVLPEKYNGSTYTIAKRAFFYTSLTKVFIPNSVGSIGENAFYQTGAKIYCEVESQPTSWNPDWEYGGSSITWGCAVTEDGLIYQKNDNEGVSIIGYIMEIDNDLIIPSIIDGLPVNAIAGLYACTSLTSVTIPDSVTSIGDNAFYNCTSLTSITIPNSVTSIGWHAFEDCTSLTSITIPNSVTSIGTYAFYNCTSLVEINFNATAMDDLSEDNYVFSYAGEDGNGIKVTIGKNVTRIPAYLFYNSYDGPNQWPVNIISVEFEEGSVCESIGIGAFFDCTSLKEVHISDIASWCNISFSGASSNPLSLAENLYINNELVTNLVIPNTVTRINDYAFCGGSFTSVTIPDRVTSIGKYAFYNCFKLTSVNFENTTGWYVTESQGATSGTDVDVTDTSTNATYLKSTYQNYYWYRKAE
ncbi:MAG: leucine-rich repeat domain-containing protein [Clostridia bacterium]|nr:leucine-rich repeat domain-containing protein [Clostridia bacterium]